MFVKTARAKLVARSRGKTVTVRLPAAADRLARACAGMANMSKPAWVARAIERDAARDYPEVAARLEKNARKGG